jgi:hypothetical protein
MITEEKWTVDDVHVQRGRVAVITYVEDFDWQWAPLLYSGVDLWLNTSKRPQEASSSAVCATGSHARSLITRGASVQFSGPSVRRASTTRPTSPERSSVAERW